MKTQKTLDSRDSMLTNRIFQKEKWASTTPPACGNGTDEALCRPHEKAIIWINTITKTSHRNPL